MASVAAIGALAFTLAACGSDDAVQDTTSPSTGDDSMGSPTVDPQDGSDLSGELAGSGSSAQESAMEAWRAGFQSANPGVNVTYDPVGSGGGRTAFLEGGVQFAGSDAALDEEELATAVDRCFGSEAFDLPVYVSPIAVVFNLEGVESLNMSAATIANVFNGTITSWDAPEIAAENPDVELPSLAITPVHRSDESGTTKNFTDYLAKASDGAWAFDASGEWPIEGGESGAQTSGLLQTVQGGEGTIGYADLSKAGDMGQVSIKVGEEWVAPSEEAAAKVLDVSPRDDARGEHDIVVNIDRATTEAGAYPLILVSYIVVCQAYDSQDDVDLVKAFLGYLASEEGQAQAESAAGSAPISDDLRADVQAAIDAIALAS
jgi:phosphate transport system substrate-binding protein